MQYITKSQVEKLLKLSNFHIHNLEQISYLTSIKTMTVYVYSRGVKNCEISNHLLPIFLYFPGLSQTALTFHSNLNINHIHFISCTLVLCLFYRSFESFNQMFSAHLVARFIVGCHFVAMCIP